MSEKKPLGEIEIVELDPRFDMALDPLGLLLEQGCGNACGDSCSNDSCGPNVGTNCTNGSCGDGCGTSCGSPPPPPPPGSGC